MSFNALLSYTNMQSIFWFDVKVPSCSKVDAGCGQAVMSSASVQKYLKHAFNYGVVW